MYLGLPSSAVIIHRIAIPDCSYSSHAAHQPTTKLRRQHPESHEESASCVCPPLISCGHLKLQAVKDSGRIDFWNSCRQLWKMMEDGGVHYTKVE